MNSSNVATATVWAIPHSGVKSSAGETQRAGDALRRSRAVGGACSGRHFCRTRRAQFQSGCDDAHERRRRRRQSGRLRFRRETASLATSSDEIQGGLGQGTVKCARFLSPRVHAFVPKATARSEKVIVNTMELSTTTEHRRTEAIKHLDPVRRSSMGQFFTPDAVAQIMAGHLGVVPGRRAVRLLDPGAGIGSLSAAAVTAICHDLDDRRGIEIVAYELDCSLHERLAETLRACQDFAARLGRRLEFEIRGENYILAVSAEETSLFGGPSRRYDAIITNPPYRKIATSSPERAALNALGVPVTNLYTAFLALAAEQLVDGGVLVGITPRSFANGVYFKPFREFFFNRVGIEILHTFEARGALFGDAEVLQENIIFRARRGSRPTDVELMLSHSATDAPDRRVVPFEQVIRPDDPHRFLRIPADAGDTPIAEFMASMPCSLPDLGIAVSTGRVVDFRAREHLRDQPTDTSAPLVYPGHLTQGGIKWPGPDGFRKPNAIALHADTEKLLLPNETYVLVKRFSAKEERKRVSAAVCTRQDLPGDVVAFENHLNVFHRAQTGLLDLVAHGLAVYLNSSFVDRYVRQFNGHTQINATDLRHLRYPTLEALSALGSRVHQSSPGDQSEIDRIVADVVTPPMMLVAEAA